MRLRSIQQLNMRKDSKSSWNLREGGGGGDTKGAFCFGFPFVLLIREIGSVMSCNST